MAPAAKAKARGRPRKSDRLTASAASSRPSSTRRPATKAQPSRLPKPTASLQHTSADDEGDDVVVIVGQPPNKNKGSNSSSVSTFNDDEPSDYSTPATSAIATPAEQPKPSTTRRGRRSAAMTAPEPTPRVDPIARARALRNSEFALTSSAQKRKRVIVDSEDDDSDNSPDAQLARAIQEEEDAAEKRSDLRSMATRPARSTTRKIKKIKRPEDFVSDYDDDDDDVDVDDDQDEDIVMADDFSPKGNKQLMVELNAKGNNSVSFPSKSAASKKAIILDSEDTDAFTDSYDDEDDEEEDVFAPEDLEISSSKFKPKSKAAIKTKKPLFTKPPSFRKKPGPKPGPKGGRAIKQGATSSRYFAQSGPSTTQEPGTKVPWQSLVNDVSDSEFDSEIWSSDLSDESDSDDLGLAPALHNATPPPPRSRIRSRAAGRRRLNLLVDRVTRRSRQERDRLVKHHPELLTMWKDLEDLPKVENVAIDQPKNINRELKPFQLEGVAWMMAMEKTDWGGGLLGDEMGMGKTIQAVTLIMSDWPAKQPSLVLIPPVALMQWQQEIADYTDGTLRTFVYHGTNAKTKGVTKQELMKYDVILMSYNSLESMYRKQEKGFKRKAGLHKEKSVIHSIRFHRVVLDEAHNIKQRTTGSAKACFALQADHKWCLSGTPLQNRIGEFFSLVRFLDIRPFAGYFCKQCPCSRLNWEMGGDNRCTECHHSGMQHVSVFNQELLNPIQKYGNQGPGKEAFRKLRILTDRFMLRRIKRDHSTSMELPAKEIYVNRQFFGEEENDFAGSIMNNGTRKFETYVAQGVLLNNYANIFGLIMQMRQVADHPDLILKKNGDGGQNVLVCCICDETAEDAIRSTCRHDFCRECAKNYLRSSDNPDCPQCHIQLSIDLEQEEHEQDEQQVKKSSIINRIKMENWTSSSKIETLVHELHELRSQNMSHKSIIFSQFTTMLQLVEWRLRRAGITTVMLDGSMTPAQRQASINHFMTNINVECFLVSLKAGGVALNLTEASRVFIVDPWWNPAAEWQSADRCHRIGQGRPCRITRLCIEDSVESRMVLLQEKKANMIRSTINADDTAMESLTPEDMQFLFRGS